MSTTAAIVGVAGSSLSAAERRLFETAAPFGFILFARNCNEPRQVSDLVQALRSAIDDPKAPVLIDQEGRTGRPAEAASLVGPATFAQNR